MAVACLLAPCPRGDGRRGHLPTSGGGATFQPPPPPPEKAKLVNGRLIAPASAPTRVKRVIAAANRIVEKPYIYGGGHKAVLEPARQGLRLLRLRVATPSTAAASCAPRSRRGALMNWGQPARARWITVYAPAATPTSWSPGYRFDTSMHDRNAPGPAHRPALEQVAPQVERVRGAPPARLLSTGSPGRLRSIFLDSRVNDTELP